MPNTYTLLETITVGGAGAASVTFNSIPQTGYTDLVLKVSGRINSSNAGWYDANITFNGVGTSYSGRWMYGNGSTTASSTESSITIRCASNAVTANTFGNAEIYIPNYTSANFKSVSIDQVAENNASLGLDMLTAGLWSNTAAITSMTLTPITSNAWMQYSTFSLYGVSALGVTPTKAPKARGGSIIQTDGTYWYHAFLSSGTFTPAVALSCDVLVVAGGGGGGYDGTATGSGGGAGGYRSNTANLLSATNYTATIGGGGATSPTGGNGSNGSDSSFNSLTSAGGGGGTAGAGSGAAKQGLSGGSGGGSSGFNYTGTIAGGVGNTPSTSPAQGNNGGTYTGIGGNRGGAGGGGAGATGGNSTAGQGGVGGAGSNAHSSWLSVVGLGVSGYLAGGGGGSGDSPSTNNAGGSGGGGIGGWNNGFAGTANTGSGGGGGAPGGTTAGAGGSGLVIVRYLA